MAFDFQPIDYGRQLGLDQQPDPRILAMQQSQLRLEQQKQAAGMLAQQQKVAQQQAYTTAVGEYLKNPTPQGAAALQAQFPDQADAIKTAWGTLDKSQQDSEFKHATTIYGLLKNNRVEDAKKALSDRIAADKAAGQDTGEEEQLLAAIDKDPGKAANFVGLTISSIGGPEKFSQIQEALRLGGAPQTEQVAPGAEVVSKTEIDPATGKLKVLYTSPYKPQLVTGPNGEVLEYTPGGGDPASGGDTIGKMLAITPFSESGNREFNADGSRVTSPKGARGVMQVMPKTAGDPGYGIAPSNGTPADDARLGREYLAKMLQVYGNPAQAWAAYNAGPGAVDKAIKDGGDQWLSKLPAETRAYVNKNMAQLQRGGAAGGSSVRALTGPKQKDQYQILTPQETQALGLNSSVKYQRSPSGEITQVPGTGSISSDVRAEGNLRREFNSLPEVKDFKTIRDASNQVKALASKKNPSATDDIALIFGYMRMLDPTSVVREGEFATAQNAAGIPDQIRNSYNRALSGNRLNPDQRQNMIDSAETVYRQRRNTYNATAERYRGLAQDYGYDPSRIAPLAAVNVKTVQEGEKLPAGTSYHLPNGKSYRSGEGPTGQSAQPVRVRSLQEARALAPGTVFITPPMPGFPNGKRKVR